MAGTNALLLPSCQQLAASAQTVSSQQLHKLSSFHVISHLA
jgi:hypothetical protein